MVLYNEPDSVKTGKYVCLKDIISFEVLFEIFLAIPKRTRKAWNFFKNSLIFPL
jgi:hypothetical protein